MKDFVKIFLGLSALAGAFLWGRHYGASLSKHSEEYRELVRANQELSFAKSELENLKTKLQNIADQAGNKKTDELLAQILNVFLVDLGLRVQQLKAPSQDVSVAEVKTEMPAQVEEKKPEVKIEKNISGQVKSAEWMLVNAPDEKSVQSALKKVQTRNFSSELRAAKEASGESECQEFLGSYRGSIKDINNKYFGSMDLNLKSISTAPRTSRVAGRAAWYSEVHKTSVEKNFSGCGLKVRHKSARYLELKENQFVQIYKLNSFEKIAGNFYEVLPNGTSKLVGSFVLNRVDRF